MSKIDRDNFKYLGVDYEMRLIYQLITDEKFANSIIGILNPNYFSDEQNKLIVNVIKQIKEVEDVIPDFKSLKIRVLSETDNTYNAKYVSGILEKIENEGSVDGFKTQEIATNFCKHQELKKSVKQIEKIIDSGDIDKYPECENILKKALEHGNIKDADMDVFDNISTVLNDDFRKPIRTGIKGLDEVMNGGLSKGELAVILAPFGVGKAQTLTSKILTPTGWTTMGDIKVGDYVISRNGKQTKVIGVYPQGIRPIYKVKFNDGTETLCDEEHLWSVNTIHQRNRKTKKNGKSVKLPSDNSFKVVRTIDMINNVKVWNNRRLNYKIPIVSPVEFNKKDLLIDPYLLGIILGDGRLTSNNQPHFVTKDEEIISEIHNIYPNISVREQIRYVEKENDGELVLIKRSLNKVSILGIKEKLIKLNLYDTNSSTKFIPKDYIYTSVQDRVSLLQGLVDSDGYIDGHRLEISTVSKKLSEGIKEIVLSLGGKVSISEKNGRYNNVSCKLVYRVSFSFPNNGIVPSRLTRKLVKYTPRTKYSENKFIKSIEYFGEEEAQCIMVDNPEHLYVTDDYIVTHNTTMITKIANTAMNDGYNVMQIFFEDNPKVIQRKHISCWTGIELNNLSFHKDDIMRICEEKQKHSKNGKGIIKLKKFPSDGTTIPIIRQYVRKKISEGFKPDLILLDYIDVVEPSRRYDDANVGEGSVMRQFESMLSELNIAGWTAVQGNRCVWIGEIVNIKNKGEIKIGEVKEGDKILTHEGYKEVTEVFPITKQAVYQIKTKSGKTIKVSAKHDFPIGNGKLKSISTGLKVGDKLLVKK